MRVISQAVLLLAGLCLSLSAFSNTKSQGETATAIFAGGCFWCMEPPYDKLSGVISTTSGYIGGSPRTANYKAVSGGGTEHVEAVAVEYDPSKVSYQDLLDVFWPNVDPLDDKGQFCDKGSQYLSYIYYSSPEEKALAEKSLAAVKKKFDAPIATEIVAATKFYPAESYHQDYYTKNPIRYKFYRSGCGRDRRLEQLWGES